MWSFCQNSCWWDRIKTVNRDTQHVVKQRDSAWNQKQWQNITLPQSSEAQLHFVVWFIIPILAVS